MKKVILFALVSIFLMSCGHFSTGESVWSEGLWIIPIGLFLASGWSFYRAYKSHKSGSNPVDASGKILTDQDAGIIPIYKIPSFWYGVALLAFAIIAIIMVNSDK